ncbi:MAG: DUF202 domain-containing protein [Firmicutes bacterium]|nr:DUF202 domain-containing protein [Bacillota bacterium]
MEEASLSTKLAYDRTALAFDRTLMAWIRTAASLISFGFTIYKFFQFDAGFKSAQGQLIGPRGFAIIMISIAILALIVSTFQYSGNIKRMHAECPGIPGSSTGTIAILVSLLGFLTLLVVVFKM